MTFSTSKHYTEPIPPTRLSSILLASWVYGVEAQEQGTVLFLVMYAAEVEHDTGTSWRNLYDEFAINKRSSYAMALSKAVLRGFRTKSETDIKDRVFSLIRLVMDLRASSERGEFDMEDIAARKILSASMSGWRTMLCALGHANLDIEDDKIRDIVSMQVNHVL